MSVIALPLLPSNKIEGAVELIKNELYENNMDANIVCFSNFENIWMRRVTPRKLSVSSNES